MSKEKMEMSQKKDFCPSSEVPTLRWFQSTGAGSWSWLNKEIA